MSRKNTQSDSGGGLPDKEHIVHLFKKYGDSLLTPCPPSERLVMYSDEAPQLTEQDRHSIETHLTVCLDCRDKVEWLSDTEENGSHEMRLNSDTTYILTVRRPGANRVTETTPTAYAARSRMPHPDEFPAVPYIAEEDGSIYGEIGQDLDHHLFLSLTHLPRAYQWHALQIRAVTDSNEVLESKIRTITEPKFELACRPDICPEDLERIELRFIPLR